VGAKADNENAFAMDGESTPLAWPPVIPVLGDGSLNLRPWRPSDADSVLSACRDPETQRWMDVPVPFLPHHAAEFVGEHAEQQWSSRRGTPFAIAASTDDQVLGSCGLVAIDAGDLVAQVVWGVHPAARGQKVAQRAGRLLCDWAMNDVGFARLEFYIEPANAASRAVAVRLGCQLEGVLRSKSLIQGTRRDFALYALLR
jgi:RimJ/RimL family protein N-acetyltransferase